MDRPRLVLPNSAQHGLRVLLCDGDGVRLARLEALAEQDLRLTGIDVYTATSVAVAQTLSAQLNIDLVITLEPAVSSYEQIRQLILANLTRLTQPDRRHTELLNAASALAHSLLAGAPDWRHAKDLSAACFAPVVASLDLNSLQLAAAVAAECVYLPQLRLADYTARLTAGLAPLAPALSASGSWLDQRSPTSAVGTAITLANFAASQQVSGVPRAEIFANIASRPVFLKHPSLRQWLTSLEHLPQGLMPLKAPA